MVAMEANVSLSCTMRRHLGLFGLLENPAALHDRPDEHGRNPTGGNVQGIATEDLQHHGVAVGPEVAVELVPLSILQLDRPDEVEERRVVQRRRRRRQDGVHAGLHVVPGVRVDLVGGVAVGAALVEVLDEPA